VITRDEKALAALLSAANAVAEGKLSAFARMAWPIVNPGRPLVWNWHMDAICEHLEAITRGEIHRLIVNVPPGHSKTTLVSIVWPVWEWIRRPQLRYLCASYSDNLARKASIDRRKILSSNWYRRAFSKERWTIDGANTQGEIGNTFSGFMLATSVGGQGTGRHGDRVVIDDPIKAADIYTVALANHVKWFNETIRTRITDASTSAFVLVMQRLHAADLSGVLEQDPTWCLLKLRSLSDTSKRAPNLVGWIDPREEDDEPLFAERFSKAMLDAERGPFGLGPIAFAAQHNQDPVADGASIFKREWWKFWTPEDLPDEFDEVFGSWDMTFKGGAETDFVVGQVFGRVGPNLYLLDQTRARLSFTDTLKAFTGLASKWPTVARWLVEEKANGAAILDVLRPHIPGLIAVNPTESKPARASAVSSLVEAGNVFLPSPAHFPWVMQLLEELSSFPHGVYDDQVDAFTQALRDSLTRGAEERFELPVISPTMNRRAQSASTMPASRRGLDLNSIAGRRSTPRE
jgi:predicted phage terminase large subunit-like protein